MLDFKFLGVNFSLSVGFLGTITLMLYIDKSGLMLPTLLSTLTHEFGHLLSLLVFNSKPKKVVLKVGSIGILGNFLLNKKGELFLYLAGPVLNFICFLLFLAVGQIFKTAFLMNFALINIVLCIFNLLPVMGLDGGSIIYLLICEKFKPSAVNIACLIISLITAALIFILGVNIFLTTKTNPTLILLALYLVLGLLMAKKQNNYCNISKNRVK